ncbi:MAG: GerMN domain-containing protein [Candidatus Wallbacteria bacterium]|nr:GerMN domain-containing protein [Candidatus Wallbacteria bacterium]
MRARGQSSSASRWLYLACSVAVLVISWAVRPETARAWLQDQTEVVRGLFGVSGGQSPPGDRAAGATGSTTAPVAIAEGGRKLTLYLPSHASPGLLEPVEASAGSAETPKELAVEAVNLLQASSAETGHRPALPPGTRLVAIFLDSGKAIVDLSAEFLATAPASAAEARVTLYALVNTLTSLPFAEEVRFLVGGEERTSYFDCFDLTVGYRFNPDIVARAPGIERSH